MTGSRFAPSHARRHLCGSLITGIVFALVSAFLLPSAGGQGAETGFSFALDRADAAAGDTVRLNVSAQDSVRNAAAFRLRVSYDEAALRFLGTETTGPTNGTLRTNSASDPIYSVYVCKVDGGSAPELSGKIATFVFQVKDAAAGSTQIGVQADEVCDFDGGALDADCSESVRLDVTAPSDEALLTGLVPSQGTLQPAFSPDRTDYRLAVGAEVSSVTFQADATSGGTVKVSRKSLGTAGSDTQIVVTVTSADKSTQRQYFVLVRRAERAQTSSAPRSAPKGKDSPPSSARAGGKTASRSAGRTATKAGKSPPSGAKPLKSSSGPGTSPENAAETGATQERLSAAQTQGAGAAGAVQITQNQMPAYFWGMLACAFCMSVGVTVYLWFTAKPKG